MSGLIAKRRWLLSDGNQFHPLPLWILLLLLSAPGHPLAALPEEFLAAQVHPPLKLGDREPDMPVWRLLDGGGAPTGFLFETRDLAAIPGLAGTPINLLVAIDNVGDFLWVSVLEHNEPVFVSGLGPEPLHSFVTQYRGLSLAHNIAVSSPYTSPTRHECFQCLDCVALYQDSNRCLPLVRVQRRRLGPQAPGHGNTGRRIPIRGSADDQAAQPVAIEVDLG